MNDGERSELAWPALQEGEGYPWRNEPLDVTHLAALWSGEWEAPAPIDAVVGTAAMALLMLGRADSPNEAEAAARKLWEERDRLSSPASI